MYLYFVDLASNTNNFHPFGDHALCQAPTDAGVGASDEGNFVGQLLHDGELDLFP